MSTNSTPAQRDSRTSVRGVVGGGSDALITAVGDVEDTTTVGVLRRRCVLRCDVGRGGSDGVTGADFDVVPDDDCVTMTSELNSVELDGDKLIITGVVLLVVLTLDDAISVVLNVPTLIGVAFNVVSATDDDEALCAVVAEVAVSWDGVNLPLSGDVFRLVDEFVQTSLLVVVVGVIVVTGPPSGGKL